MLVWLTDMSVLQCTNASASHHTAASCCAPLVLCWLLSSPLMRLSLCHCLSAQPTHPLAGCPAYASHSDTVSCPVPSTMPLSFSGWFLSLVGLPAPRWWQQQHRHCLLVPLVLFWLLPLVCFSLQCPPPIGGNRRIAVIFVSLSSQPEGHHLHGTSSKDSNRPLSSPFPSHCPLAHDASHHQPSPLPLMVGCCILCLLRCRHPLSLLIARHCVIIDALFASHQQQAANCLGSLPLPLLVGSCLCVC
jgi:hypothetical protein